jgi:hypothetical protein
MDNSSPNPLLQAWPGLLALFVTIVGIITAHQPLESQRPPAGATDGALPSPDGVPARLWQDPLKAVWGTNFANRKRGDGPDMAALTKHVSGLTPDGGSSEPVLFIFDCLYAEDSAEMAEQRRRERYATLAALGTARYEPEDSTQLRFATLGGRGRPEYYDWAIPYEWWVPAKGVKAKHRAVCVLWVPKTDRLDYLCSLKRALTVPKSRFAFAVKGMIDTTDLQSLLDIKALDGSLQNVFTGDDTLYVTYSTAPGARGGAGNEDALCACGLTPEYVIGTDDVLAKNLLDELKRRGIATHNKDSKTVAIVAERDTDYGRSMHHYFGMGEDNKKPICAPYWYLRGLDGAGLHERPSPTAAPAANGTKDRDDSGGEANAEPKPAAGSKQTAADGEGDRQFDYLLRLADQMKADLPDLQAIGVLGNDPYDKLLILRALRPRFPRAVFFTTDLDVRLLQPPDYSDTRNVLIASHFGLSLNPKLQSGVPPFRSGYDTASYLSCLLAVGFEKVQSEDVQCHLTHPYLYEIGRSGPYELTLYGENQDPLGAANPRRDPWVNKRLLPLILSCLLVGALLYPLSRPWQRFVQSWWRGVTWLTFFLRTGLRRVEGMFASPGPPSEVATISDKAQDSPPSRGKGGGETPAPRWYHFILALGGSFLVVALPFAVWWAHAHENHEPFELFEGISSWPTIIIWVFAIVICVYDVYRAWGHLSRSGKTIRKSTFRRPDEEGINAAPPPNWAKTEDESRPWLGRFLRRTFRGWLLPDPKEGSTVWDLYLDFEREGALWRRAVRCVLLVAGVALLFVTLAWLFGFDRFLDNSGGRGWIARYAARGARFLTILALVGLLAFVADSTLLALRFVRLLQRRVPARVWPPEVMEWVAETSRGLPKPSPPDVNQPCEGVDVRTALDHWLTVRLIHQVTNVVARLILSPFVVLLVLFVAQNRIFADWHWDPASVFITLSCSVICLALAVLLQRSAREARANSVKALDRLLLPRAGRTEDPVGTKLARVRSDVAGFNTGAFASWWTNPVAQAVLLAAGGGGALAALEAALTYLSK